MKSSFLTRISEDGKRQKHGLEEDYVFMPNNIKLTEAQMFRQES